MPQIETAEQIAAWQRVSAAAVLENRADMRTYPHVYVTLHAPGTTVKAEGLRQLVAAAEVLHRIGFELVSVIEITNHFHAVLRRRS
jgi:hypothetical protein